MTYYLSPYDDPRPQGPDDIRPFRLTEHRTGRVLCPLWLTGREVSDLNKQLEDGLKFQKFIKELKLVD